MLGIGENLKAALVSVEQELAAVEQRANVLRQRMATLKAWIAEERPHAQQAELLPSEIPQKVNYSLGDFVRETLADGIPRTTPELGEIASQRKLIDADKSPTRAVHFALISLEHHGHIEKDKQDRWRLLKQ